MNSIAFDQVSEGLRLPELEVDVSTGLIVATAIASRDYQNVHHDRDQAVALGSKDIFMNILSTNGFVGRFVTDWTGPDGELKRVNIRLGVPNYAGDTMTISGVVKSKRIDNDQCIVDIDVVGKNSLGNHVTALVVVALPRHGEE
jgi:acyl dehydratase